MMLRTMVALLGAVVIVGAATPVMAGGCKGCDKVAKTGDGFCCGKGKAFGVELASKKLYTALAGKKIDIENIRCPGCKTAAKTSGKCSHCNVGIADGKVFHSSVSHTLAKGKPMTAEKAAHCDSCKTAFKDNGRCTGCSVGFVAGRSFKDNKVYEAAVAALKTLVAAVYTAKKCEACAVAMVTDGECTFCKLKFKDGKKITG